MVNGKRILRTYHRHAGKKVWLVREVWATAIEYDEGPFHISMLRHPDLLTGIVKEIDGAE